jgi:hypothetical protein
MSRNIIFVLMYHRHRILILFICIQIVYLRREFRSDVKSDSVASAVSLLHISA